MKKRFSILTLITAILVSAIIASMVTFSTVFRYSGENSSSSDFLEEMNMLRAVDYAYRNNYFGDIDDKKLEKGLIQGYIYGVGDRYGEYMDAERVEEFNVDYGGESVGIGISVVYNSEHDLVEIISVVTDSPAAEAGIMPGDLIYKVGEKDAKELGYEGTINAMLGAEGTEAVFTLKREEQLTEYSLVRRVVKQENARGRMHSDGITGIIKLEEFDDATFPQFKALIEELTGKGAVRFVFDVRNNSGGELESILSILDTLLPEGPIIRIESKEGTEEVRESDAGCYTFPMAVLVNENTASAAELFAAALKDYEVATLVGKTTYGKGSMQSILPLIDGSALRITYRMYKPPFSDGYDGVGVKPDIDVDMADEYKNVSIYKLTDTEDTQLVRAIEYLNNGN